MPNKSTLKRLILAVVLTASSLFARTQIVIPSTAHVYKLDAGCFDIDVYAVFTRDTTFAHAFQDSLMPPIANDSYECRGSVSYVDQYPIVLWMPRVPQNLSDYAVLNHELLHLVACTMQWAGVPLSDDTQEVYAFMMQYYTKQLYKNFNKLKNQK